MISLILQYEMTCGGGGAGYLTGEGRHGIWKDLPFLAVMCRETHLRALQCNTLFFPLYTHSMTSKVCSTVTTSFRKPPYSDYSAVLIRSLSLYYLRLFEVESKSLKYLYVNSLFHLSNSTDKPSV